MQGVFHPATVTVREAGETGATGWEWELDV